MIMSAKYISASKGKKFTPTELGMTVDKVKGKYEDNKPWGKGYERVVPYVWMKNGWIKEVDNGS